jgi:lipopolysaccharide biosynthesis glycosyltransferase
MIITLSTDNNFVMPAGVAMVSICENNADVAIHFWIFTQELSIEHKDKLTGIAKKYSKEITIVDVNIKDLEGTPYISAYKLAAYFRLLLPALLPVEIEKVIYLDCDLIVRKSLTELWHTDISQYSCGAVIEQLCDDIVNYNRLDYKPESGYFNTGLLLINLTYWRENQTGIKAIEWLRSNHEKCWFADQDALNVVLHDTILWLHPKYNVQPQMWFEYQFMRIRKELWKEVAEAAEAPVVVHYVSPDKPWNKECSHPYKNEFLKYYALSPWRNIPLKSMPLKWTIRLTRTLGSILEKMGLNKRDHSTMFRKITPLK